jgi:hypothetical protein
MKVSPYLFALYVLANLYFDQPNNDILLRVLDNGLLRRIFGPRRDETTGEWRKLHIEELHNIYSSPDIIR